MGQCGCGSSAAALGVSEPHEIMPNLLGGAAKAPEKPVRRTSATASPAVAWGPAEGHGDDYVPVALRHGPREMEHMRQLGLVAEQAKTSNGTEANGASAPDPAKKGKDTEGRARAETASAEIYVPMALRHGPRELAHMRALGLISEPAVAEGPGRARANTAPAAAKKEPAVAEGPGRARANTAPAAAKKAQGDIYVPMALRHGPRELAHLRALGLISEPAVEDTAVAKGHDRASAKTAPAEISDPMKKPEDVETN